MDQTKPQQAHDVMSNIGEVSRQSGKAVIKDLIANLHKQAASMQVLVDMLPENPTSEQDVVLWNIGCELRRRLPLF